MRIAFIKQKFVESGGGELYLDRLLDVCARRGHEVHLITASGWSEFRNSLTVHSVPIDKSSRSRRSRSFAASVETFLEGNHFDAVVSLDRVGFQDIWRAGEGVHRVWLARRKEFESPLRTRFAEWTSGHKALLALEKRSVLGSKHIIANSQMVADDISRTYGAAAPEVTVIHNGVDPAKFHPVSETGEADSIRKKWNIPEKRSLLLFPGSGFARKGLPETLSVLSRVREGHLVVFGRDKPDRWFRLARRIGVADRVTFAGTIADLAPCYRAADLVLLPSWFDPFPNAGLEALFCGTPVITTLYSGNAEVIEAPGCGSVIEKPSALDAFESAIREQLEIGKSRDRSNRIHESVKSFTLEANVEKTLGVISQVAAKT